MQLQLMQNLSVSLATGSKPPLPQLSNLFDYFLLDLHLLLRTTLWEEHGQWANESSSHMNPLNKRPCHYNLAVHSKPTTTTPHSASRVHWEQGALRARRPQHELLMRFVGSSKMQWQRPLLTGEWPSAERVLLIRTLELLLDIVPDPNLIVIHPQSGLMRQQCKCFLVPQMVSTSLCIAFV